jgi:hypothetical protein
LRWLRCSRTDPDIGGRSVVPGGGHVGATQDPAVYLNPAVRACGQRTAVERDLHEIPERDNRGIFGVEPPLRPISRMSTIPA